MRTIRWDPGRKVEITRYWLPTYQWYFSTGAQLGSGSSGWRPLYHLPSPCRCVLSKAELGSGCMYGPIIF